MKTALQLHHVSIKWVEWVLLLLSFGVIAVTLRNAHWLDSEMSSQVGHRKLAVVSDPALATTFTIDRQLAENALLAELSLAYPNNQHAAAMLAQNQWHQFGISPDKTAFFEYLRNHPGDTLLSANAWFDKLLEAQQLYDAVEKSLFQGEKEEEMFRLMEAQFCIPVQKFRQMRLAAEKPATASQWAVFVSENRGH